MRKKPPPEQKATPISDYDCEIVENGEWKRGARVSEGKAYFACRRATWTTFWPVEEYDDWMIGEGLCMRLNFRCLRNYLVDMAGRTC